MDAGQIRDQLLAEILDGGPGIEHGFDEYATVRRLGAPRAVVRDALGSLAEAGLLTRAPRSGTALANPLHFWSVEHAASLAESALLPLTYDTVGIERVRATDAVSRELTGASGSTVTRIRRINRIGGRAAEHWTIWTALELPERVYTAGLPTDLNWYEYVGALTGQSEFDMTRRTVDCRATAADIALLDMELGDPLRFTSRRLSFADGTPIDRSWGRIDSRVVIASERFRIRV